MTKITYIPGEIANAAVDENGNRKPVTRTQHIFDDALDKPQSQVNQDRIEDIAAEVQRAQGAESTLDGKIGAEKTRAEGVEEGLNTRLQIVEELAEISVGGGDIGIGTAADFESDDPEDLAKVPTVSAILGGTNDGVYDISARHSGTKYADLEAALGTNGANVPPTLRKGGMSVKFVQSSDNKYVQFRCMSDEFTTDTTKWAIADEGVYVDNPEFIRVYTDKNGKTLFGIKTDGTVVFGAGVPKQVVDYISKLFETGPIKVSIIGDSISTYDKKGYNIDGYSMYYPEFDVQNVNDTWWKEVIDEIGGNVEVNASSSLSTATNDTIGFSPRVDMLGNPDYVIVALGTNDSLRVQAPIGEIDYDDPTPDLSYFAPAYIAGIKRIKQVYPTANILCVIFAMTDAYADVIKEVAGHYGCDCVDVRDVATNASTGLNHPDKEGMAASAGKVLSVISNGLKYIELSRYIDNPEYSQVTLDINKKVIEGIRKDGTKDIKVNVSLDGPVVGSASNPEFLDVKLDANGKVVEGTKNDGTKYIGGDFELLGKQKIGGFEYEVITSIEWAVAWIDAKKKVLMGIKAENGEVWTSNINLTEYLNRLKPLVGNQDNMLSVIQDAEWLNVELDANGKVLGGRTSDGVRHELNGLNIDSALLEGIGDIEERTEIKVDRKNKVIAYRSKDGVLYENVGIGAKEVQTDNLNLSEAGMNRFQQALKDSGFNPGGAGDFSENSLVELPEIKNYGIMNLIVSSLPVGSGEMSEGYVEYYDFSGNYFKKSCALEPQGQSTRIFAMTGGKGNYTLDITDGSEIKFGSWVPQDSFHLKGNAKDCTRGILATSYKWAYMFMEYLDAKPNRVLLKSDNSTTTTHASGDRFTDWPSDARCMPDGFPVEVYVNGEYWGLYSLQLKKHRKNYSMNKKDYTTFFIDADKMMEGNASEGYHNGFWNLGPSDYWTTFEIKNPKDLICMDGSAYDGDDPKELIDSTSPYYDSSNKKHKGSAQTKAIIEAMSTKYLEVKGYIDNSDIATAKEKFNEYFDYNACLFVYIYNCLMRNHDSIAKNTLWAVYGDGKIAPMLWDLDGMYGQGTYCDIPPAEPTAYMWEGNYATSAWPLALLWSLYEAEIKAAYADLRRDGIISIKSWRSVMYGQWMYKVGEDAFNRDIEKWPETPSYRKNYTDTDYWQQISHVASLGDYHVWDSATEYAANDVVALRLHPKSTYYMLYKAVQPSQNVCPVTKFYEMFPMVGGFYDSAKRFEKWMTEQIRLCDTVMNYSE